MKKEPTFELIDFNVIKEVKDDKVDKDNKSSQLNCENGVCKI